jgi:hypothetical protein
MAKGDAFWRNEERKTALKNAESAGLVADSMEVRKQLIARMDAGELTLEQAQAELAAIKRGAKKAGKMTRTQAFR